MSTYDVSLTLSRVKHSGSAIIIGGRTEQACSLEWCIQMQFVAVEINVTSSKTPGMSLLFRSCKSRSDTDGGAPRFVGNLGVQQ